MSAESKKTVGVIGGGPAGYAAAFHAADLGLDVTLIDLDVNPGGTCLYRGCIPSKALLHVARVLEEAKEVEHFGVKFAKPKIDVGRLRQATADVVSKMTGGLGQLSRARKIQYMQGRAGFLDDKTVRVHGMNGEEDDLNLDYYVVATGSRPAMIPHLMLESDRVMNSTDALELPDIPKRLLVIGGGYIGLELTTVYAALGSKVTVVDVLPSLLASADKDLVKPLAVRIEAICENVYLETAVQALEEVKDGIEAAFEPKGGKPKKETFDRVLIAVGRKPNSSGVGLDNTGVAVNEQGFVEVDDQFRTAVPNIFAVGDLVGQPMLAHKGTYEGKVAAEVIAGHRVGNDAKCIPAVVFTDPEIAWVGLSESEAKASGQTVKVGRFPWAASSRAATLHRTEGLTKIIADPDTGVVLGVGMVGTGVGEMIAEGALAIEMGATAEDLGLTIHPHPTLSETIMESAELVGGTSVHLYRPPKRKKKAS